MMIVIVIIGIIVTLVVPAVGTLGATRLIAAGRLLAADIEYAQSESIARPDDPRLIKLDQANNSYWIAAASDVNTPINDPASQGSFLVQFGTGRAYQLGGVTISSFSLNGNDELHFDGLGQPDQTTVASIVLASDGASLTISIAPISGEVTVQ